MIKKITIITCLLLNLSSCYKKKKATPALPPEVTASQSELTVSLDDIKKYLNDKGIAAEKVEDMNGAHELYEVKSNSSTFYIDKNKNVYFGMVLNLDTGINLTLTAQKGQTILIDIKDKNLLPFPTKRMNDLPEIQTKNPADLEMMIKSLELTLEKFKIEKNAIEQKNREHL